MTIRHCNASLIRFLVRLVTSVALWLWTYGLSEFCTDYVRQRSSPVWKRKRSSASISHWRLMASSVHGGETEPEANEEICERSVLRAPFDLVANHAHMSHGTSYITERHTCQLPITNSASPPKRKKERKTLLQQELRNHMTPKIVCDACFLGCKRKDC